MTIVTIASAKGGVGKTTTAVSLASALANFDKVLLVDGDAQSHVTLSFGLPVRGGLFDWLVRGLPLRDCTLSGRPNALAILPGDSLTKTVERLFGERVEFERLVEQLRGLHAPGAGFAGKMVVIDTAAGGLFQEAALAAADQVVIPFRAEALGLDSLFQTLELIRQLAPRARVTLLPTAFDTRLSEQRDNLTRVKNEYGAAYGLGDDWNEYVIRQRTAVAEAVSYGKTIWEYNGQGIQDARRAYSALVARVLALAARGVEESKVTSGTGN